MIQNSSPVYENEVGWIYWGSGGGVESAESIHENGTAPQMQLDLQI